MCEALVSAMSGVCVNMYITCGYRNRAVPPKIPGPGSKWKSVFFYCSSAYLHRFSHRSTHFLWVFLSLGGEC